MIENESKLIVNYPLIVSLAIGMIVVLVIVIFGPYLNNQLKIYQKPPISVSVEPRIANLTIEGNETVSKRIRLFFSEPVYLVKLVLRAPPNLDEHLDIENDTTDKSQEHFVYVIINNSKSNLPQGEYEGVIRPYYSIDKNSENMSSNIAIPMNIAIGRSKQDSTA